MRRFARMRVGPALPPLGLLGALIAVGVACNLPALGPSPAPTPEGPQPTVAAALDPQVEALERLERDSSTAPEIVFENGFPVSVSVRVRAEGANPVERARAFLAAYRDLYLQDNPDLSLEVLRVSEEDGASVVFYQAYQGIPVDDGEIAVFVDDEEVYFTGGSLLKGDTDIDTRASIAPADAEAIALAFLASPATPVSGVTTLTIFDGKALELLREDPRLAWKVTLGGRAPHRVFVDAHTGEVIYDHSLVVSGSPDYDFEEWNANGSNAPDSWCYWKPGPFSIGDEDGMEKPWHLEQEAGNVWHYTRWAYDFFHGTFNRHSYDNDDSQIEVGIRANVENAAWWSGCDIIEFRDGWVAYDILVHELAHGVVAYMAEFNPGGQPGALNESFADIMAVMAEDQNWLIGEARTNGQGAIRDLANGLPDRWSGYSSAFTVHQNSLIMSRAYYLMDAGGFHNGWHIEPIGRAKVRNLAWGAFLTLWSDAGFQSAANQAITRAGNLAKKGTHGFTTHDACQVRNAFAAVELATGDLGCDGTLDPGAYDTDGDYIVDPKDNCVTVKNPDQKDNDADGKGDACDDDDDNDGRSDLFDNCPFAFNPSQGDRDKDGKGDACDDHDKDGVLDDVDNCYNIKNPLQYDLDGDGKGDDCDDDRDGDGVKELGDCIGYVMKPGTFQIGCEQQVLDNCPYAANPDQADSDGDKVGDACDVCPNFDDHKAGFGYVQGKNPKSVLLNPLACPATAVVGEFPQGLPNITPDGLPGKFDVPGRPGVRIALPLPACPPGSGGWYAEDDRALLELTGPAMGARFLVVDEEGRKRGRSEAYDDRSLLLFRPPAGKLHWLDIFFPDSFPEGGRLDLTASLTCGMRDALLGSFPERAGSGLEPPPTDLLPPGFPGFVETPTATATPACVDKAAFVADVTIPDNTNLAPGSPFTKTWRLRNDGTCPWGPSYRIVFVGGEPMGNSTPVPIPGTVPPGSTVDLSLALTAPGSPGTYKSNYRIRNPLGIDFGVGATGLTPFYVQIVVGDPTSPPPPPPAPDTQAPSVRIVHTPSGDWVPTTSTITFSAAATDNVAVTSIEIWVTAPGQFPSRVKTCTNSTTCIFTGGPYSAGALTYSATARDAAGNEANSGAKTITIYVVVSGRPGPGRV